MLIGFNLATGVIAPVLPICNSIFSICVKASSELNLAAIAHLGNLLVLPNLAALKETGSKSKFLYEFTDNHSDHINTFQKQLTHAIQYVQKQSEDYRLHLEELKNYSDKNYNLNDYLKKWERVLSNK